MRNPNKNMAQKYSPTQNMERMDGTNVLLSKNIPMPLLYLIVGLAGAIYTGILSSKLIFASKTTISPSTVSTNGLISICEASVSLKAL